MLTDAALAARYAPILRFDRAEPFLPSRAGYSVMRQPADSQVDPRRTLAGPQPLRFDLPGLEAVLEYGIWWDWDIEHLYELEAAWVYLGDGNVLRVEASWHGGFHAMEVNGQPPLRGSRPVLYSQPGKHAFASEPTWFEPPEKFTAPCRDRAGSGGVLVAALFEDQITKSAVDDARAAAYLRSRAFTPTFRFDTEFPLAPEHLCPWAELRSWIPDRVERLMQELLDGTPLD